MVSIDDVRAARERIAGQVVLTPCTPSGAFGETFCGRAWFKYENLQRTGSFKERGALNRMLLLSPEERRRGVVSASAGNHAQAVAFHARRLGIPATIVMPERSPLVKVSSTEGYGARVVLEGSVYDESMAEARRIGDAEGLVLVHPFDDPAVIAGQGTIALELLEQCPELEVVVVGVGGGGMAAGIAAATKALRPEVRVVGVEAAVIPAALRAREAGAPVTIAPAETIAEGIAVRRIGEVTFPLLERWVDDLVTVEEEEITDAVLRLLERGKTLAEASAAAPVAAVVNGRVRGLEGRSVAMVLSGGNIDASFVSRIIDRGMRADGRLASLRVRVDDRPGSLAGLTATLAAGGANIFHIAHARGGADLGVRETEIEMTLETRGRAHVRELADALVRQGHRVVEG
jgi:threonine dehydratase